MSPFDFKHAFLNVDQIRVWLLKQSCRTLNLEQLLFLEIFELPYKFESNLKNEASGNSVNTLNSASRQLSPAASFHRHLRAPVRDTSCFDVSAWSLRVERTSPAALRSPDKSESALLLLSPFLCFPSASPSSDELASES